MRQGDVVMVEPDATIADRAACEERQAGGRAPSPRLALRQIPAVQGALVSLDPTTGRVLAMVGGWSFEGSQFNRATQAQRQPGSSFKPFVYLTALEKGISPSQRFLDAPIVMDTAAGRWRPNNYEMEFGGPTPLRVALEKSLNLVTLRVAQTVGMEAIAQNADRLPRGGAHAARAAGGARRGGNDGDARGRCLCLARRGRPGGDADADRQRAGSATATWSGGRPRSTAAIAPSRRTPPR